jgi:hypothetical protein
VPYSDTPVAPPQVSGHHHGAPVENLALPAATGSLWWTIGLAEMAEQERRS